MVILSACFAPALLAAALAAPVAVAEVLVLFDACLTVFAFLITCRNANTMPIMIRNGNNIRNHDTPGCPLSQRKLRKYVHNIFINNCHIVARKCVEVAENPMVDKSDMPKYS